ncbi:hypothetical protein D3C72_2580260 [compost metagenome]
MSALRFARTSFRLLECDMQLNDSGMCTAMGGGVPSGAPSASSLMNWNRFAASAA